MSNVSKKILQYFVCNRVKCFVGIIIFSFIFVLAISKLPVTAVDIFAVCLLLLVIAMSIASFCKIQKEKQKFQSMTEEDYKKKWEQYICLINETIDEDNYEWNELNAGWFQKFNDIMYALACFSSSLNSLQRKFNDFDIASCLIYSLTWDNNTDENILFAFHCAKKIISAPKEYIRDIGFSGYKLELKEYRTFPSVSIDIPDEAITPQALISTLRTYLMRKSEYGIIQLSDYLHILYLNCK